MVGNLVATSILQGGPGLPVLLPAAYQYIWSGQCNVEDMNAIPDPLTRNLLSIVRSRQLQY